MATYWLTGFLIGVFLSRFGLVPTGVHQCPWWATMLATVSAGCLLVAGRFRKGLFVLALLAGVLAEAPPPDRKEPGFRIIRAPLLLPYGTALASDGHRIFAVKTDAPKGAWGSVEPPRRKGSLPLGPGRFLAHEPSEERAPAIHSKVHQALRQSLKGHHPDIRAVAPPLLLGDGMRIPRRLKEAFFDTGLYHILVVSGFHVALTGAFITLVFQIPLNGVYALRLIGPGTHQKMSRLVPLSAGVITGFYAWLTGLGSPAQRSFILFLAHQAARLGWFRGPRSARIATVAAWQSLVFPLGFVSESTLLSWGAYLFVIEAAGRKVTVGTHFVLQLRMFALLGAVIGVYSPAGLLANPLVDPLFPIAFAGLAFGVWMEPQALLTRVLLAPCRIFVDGVELLAVWLPDSLPGMDTGTLRALCVVYASYSWLCAIRDLDRKEAKDLVIRV